MNLFSFLILWENSFLLPSISMADTNVQENDSFWLTFSAGIKWKEYIQSIPKSATRKVGSLCYARAGFLNLAYPSTPFTICQNAISSPTPRFQGDRPDRPNSIIALLLALNLLWSQFTPWGWISPPVLDSFSCQNIAVTSSLVFLLYNYRFLISPKEEPI